MGTLLDKWRANKGDKNLTKELHEKLIATLPIVNLDTHYKLADTVSEGMRPYIIDFAKQMIEEYDCKTVSEKALVEVIVGAHARVLEYSQVLNRIVRLGVGTHELIAFYSMVGKELDRANRHFLSALATLRQIKSPSIEVQVKARTAFIGGNQQFNTTQSTMEQVKVDYEINTPK